MAKAWQLTMLARQFGVFLGVGLVCAALDVGVTGGLLWAGVHHSLAATVGFATGLLLNFLGHTRLSFETKHSSAMAARFGLVVALNYGLTLGAVEAAAYWLNNPMLGKLIALPVVALNAFIWAKYWVFK